MSDIRAQRIVDYLVVCLVQYLVVCEYLVARVYDRHFNILPHCSETRSSSCWWPVVTDSNEGL